MRLCYHSIVLVVLNKTARLLVSSETLIFSPSSANHFAGLIIELQQLVFVGDGFYLLQHHSDLLMPRSSRSVAAVVVILLRRAKT